MGDELKALELHEKLDAIKESIDALKERIEDLTAAIGAKEALNKIKAGGKEN